MNGFEFVMMRRYAQLLDKSREGPLTSAELFEFLQLELRYTELQEREKQGQAIANKPVRPPLAKGAH